MPVEVKHPCATRLTLGNRQGGHSRQAVSIVAAVFAIAAFGRGFGLAEHNAAAAEPVRAKAARTVTVDRERRIVLVDGQPFFPLGCFCIGEAWLGQAGEGGLNCTIRAFGWQKWVTEKGADRAKRVRQYLDAAHEAGLMVIERPDVIDPPGILFYGDPRILQTARKLIDMRLPWIVEAVRDHPALLTYFGPDEPNGCSLPEWPGLLKQYSDAIRERDPRHPILFGFGGSVSKGRTLTEWQDAFDITAVNWYPWRHAPLSIVRMARRNAEAAHRIRSPYWHVARMGGWSAAHHQKIDKITPLEQRLQTYLAIIGGAQGLFWFHWPPRTTVQWEGLRDVLKEVRELSPILLEGSPPFRIRGQPQDLAFAVPTLIKNHDGRAYLLVANAARFPVDASFRLPSGEGAVDVLFTDRRLAIEGALFEDRIDAFGTRVYKLPSTWPQGGTLHMTIRRLRAKEKKPTVRMPETRAPNLIADPYFQSKQYWTRLRQRKASKQSRGRGEFPPGSKKGRGMLHLQTDDQPGCDVRFVGRPIELRPRTRYLFAASGRVWGLGAERAFVALSPFGRGVLAKSGWSWTGAPMLGLPSLAADAQTVFTTFVTGPNPFSVRPTCWLRDGPAEAWVEELALNKLPNSRNLLNNTGFENVDQVGGPRHWETGRLVQAGIMTDPDSICYLDRGERYEGTRSLRLRLDRRSDRRVARFRGEEVALKQVCYYPPRRGETLTLSFYARGVKASPRSRYLRLHVTFQHGGTGSQVPSITPEWKRYSLTQRAKKDAPRLQVGFHHFTDPGTVWIDAVQVEAGPKATAYEDGGW